MPETCRHCGGEIEQRNLMSGNTAWCRTSPEPNVAPHWCTVHVSHQPVSV